MSSRNIFLHSKYSKLLLRLFSNLNFNFNDILSGFSRKNTSWIYSGMFLQFLPRFFQGFFLDFIPRFSQYWFRNFIKSFWHLSSFEEFQVFLAGSSPNFSRDSFCIFFTMFSSNFFSKFLPKKMLFISFFLEVIPDYFCKFLQRFLLEFQLDGTNVPNGG